MYMIHKESAKNIRKKILKEIVQTIVL